MLKRKVFEEILNDLDIETLPIRYIRRVKIINSDGDTIILKGEEIADFRDDPDAYSPATVSVALDVNAIQRAVAAEIARFEDDILRMQETRTQY